MQLAKGMLGAIIGGGLGAALWTAVAYATGLELTLLAIVVGGLAGAGMTVGSNKRGGASAGVMAALVSVVCILSAKLAVAHLFARDYIASQDLSVTEDDARTAIMDHVWEEFDTQGKQLSEPTDEGGYPPEVWTEADRRWHHMTPDQRASLCATLEAENRQGAQQASGILTILAFIFSFGLFDLLCLGLAVSTAYKTGAHGSPNDPNAALVDDDAPTAPALFRVAEAAATTPQPVASVPPAGRPTPPPPPEESELPSAGIFGRLGHGESGNAPAPARRPMQPQDDEVGLIRLDFDDDQQARKAA